MPKGKKGKKEELVEPEHDPAWERVRLMMPALRGIVVLTMYLHFREIACPGSDKSSVDV
jgi:hypothetical protein